MTDSRADRLPWLTDTGAEPAATPAGAPPRRRRLGGWIVAMLAALVAVAGLGYWLGRRHEPAPAPRPAPVTSLTPKPAPTAPTPGTSPAPKAETVATADSAPPVASPERAHRSEPHRAAHRAHRTEHRAAHRHPRVRHADTARPAYRRTVEHQKVPAPNAVTWYQIPLRAGPPGRAIQLGAYWTRSDAQLAWRYILRRWPYLGSRPMVLLPTTARPGVRVLWRIQLRTDSQAQSLVICQRLRATGQSCMVIY